MTMKQIQNALFLPLCLGLTGCLTYTPEPFPIDEYTQELSAELAEQRALNTALKQRISLLESDLTCEEKLP